MFWHRQRRRVLLDGGSVNLNAGTMSPTPREVMQAVTRLRRAQAANPSDFLWRQTPPLLETSRGRLAEFLHCRPADLALLPNVTWAVNLVATSLRLPAGSEVLTTDHEYGAMTMTWRRACRARSWRLRHLNLPYRSEDPDELVAAVERALGPRTRLLFFSHVTSPTGLVLPAAKICAAARWRKVLTVLDGAHAPGMVPVDLRRIGADFYGANCHKWMMAPATCGFLHVRREHKKLLQPLITSWGWGYKPAQAERPSGAGGSRWQHNLEFHGCTDRCPQMVLDRVLDFRASLGGEEAIAARCADLSDYARHRLGACGLRPATPAHPLLHGALTAFEAAAGRDLPPHNWLWNEHRIECPITLAAGKRFLRVSTAWFNTKAEIDRLARAIETFWR